ncbi:unnamed protein product, partial [Cylicocyclus nassatus]
MKWFLFFLFVILLSAETLEAKRKKKKKTRKPTAVNIGIRPHPWEIAHQNLAAGL